MAVYSFKRDTELFLVHNDLKYKLDIYSDLTFSQTFSEEAVSQKTLHDNNNFEEAVIVKASPANFSFTMPMVPEQAIVFNLLVGYDVGYTNINCFDLYAQTALDTYKIDGCVLEGGRFITSMSAVLGMSVSGSGKRLKRVGTGSFDIPGELQPLPSKRYTMVRNVSVAINDIVQQYIQDIYVELRNKVEWTSNDTLHASLLVTDVDNTIYPENFVVTGRLLNGAITQYINDETTESAQSWGTNATVYVRVGTGGSEYALQLLAPKVVFTNRADVTDVYTQVYDFRMTTNLELAQ